MSLHTNHPSTGLSIDNPAVNLFTRRTFMKTSALTVGAVALLSQGRALATEGDSDSSSTIPQINPPYGAGVKRTKPVPDTPPTVISPSFGGFVFVTTVNSPCGVSACKVSDEVTYSSTVVVKQNGNPINWLASDSRFFIAYQVSSDPVNGPSIHSWEVTSEGAATIQPSISRVSRSGTKTIGVTTYRLCIETERTACGQNVVAVKARALLINTATDEITELDWTAERFTEWQDCNSGQ